MIIGINDTVITSVFFPSLHLATFWKIFLYLSIYTQGRGQVIIEEYHTTTTSESREEQEWSWLQFWLWSEVRYPPISSSFDNIRSLHSKLTSMLKRRLQ